MGSSDSEVVFVRCQREQDSSGGQMKETTEQKQKQEAVRAVARFACAAESLPLLGLVLTQEPQAVVVHLLLYLLVRTISAHTL